MMQREKHIFFALIAAALTMGAALVRWPYVGEFTLWLDESATVDRACRGLTFLFFDIHPGGVKQRFFYLLMHFYFQFVNCDPQLMSETFIRFPQFLLGTLTVPLLFGLCVFVGRPLVGVIWALLVLADPAFVRYSAECRAYAFNCFFAVCLCIFTIWCLKERERAASKTALASLSVLAFLVSALHYASIPFVAVWTFLVFVYLRIDGRPSCATVWALLVGTVLGTVIFLGPLHGLPFSPTPNKDFFLRQFVEQFKLVRLAMIAGLVVAFHILRPSVASGWLRREIVFCFSPVIFLGIAPLISFYILNKWVNVFVGYPRYLLIYYLVALFGLALAVVLSCKTRAHQIIGLLIVCVFTGYRLYYFVPLPRLSPTYPQVRTLLTSVPPGPVYVCDHVSRYILKRQGMILCDQQCADGAEHEFRAVFANQGRRCVLDLNDKLVSKGFVMTEQDRKIVERRDLPFTYLGFVTFKKQ